MVYDDKRYPLVYGRSWSREVPDLLLFVQKEHEDSIIDKDFSETLHGGFVGYILYSLSLGIAL